MALSNSSKSWRVSPTSRIRERLTMVVWAILDRIFSFGWRLKIKLRLTPSPASTNGASQQEPTVVE